MRSVLFSITACICLAGMITMARADKTTTVTIDDSPASPTLNGRIIDISGVTTDVNGGYTISFLP